MGLVYRVMRRVSHFVAVACNGDHHSSSLLGKMLSGLYDSGRMGYFTCAANIDTNISAGVYLTLFTVIFCCLYGLNVYTQSCPQFNHS